MDQASPNINATESTLNPSKNAEEKAPYLPSVSIIDTSALKRISEAQLEYLNDESDSTNKRHAQANLSSGPISLLQWLCDDESTPPRTLIIPHEALREIFVSKDKHSHTQGVKWDGNGYLECHINSKTLKHTESKLLAGWLNKKEDLGQIRCYSDIDQMIAAKEISHPEGGIIILNSNVANLPLDQIFSSDGQYERYAGNLQRADQAIKKTIEKLKQHYPDGISIPVLTRDRGVGEPPKERDGIPWMKSPFSLNLRGLVNSMEKLGQIDNHQSHILFDLLTTDDRKDGYYHTDFHNQTSSRLLQINAFTRWFEHLSEPRQGVAPEQISNGVGGR